MAGAKTEGSSEMNLCRTMANNIGLHGVNLRFCGAFGGGMKWKSL